ncbi:Glycosyltransferase involved in cell wall bisynthesis [Butyrivibrio fibrisolvens]|uniref:Glycosyltransferase involved in cell wall bisynthesis n=1 Tax=Butyrivibrio fibrisolvens TaxID=831 RepID=A0A1H9Q390_BUTFI|nr:glycosyltransferase family 4 protein [Butyrivibrio fibrisolvens]SER54565.1 Glycosyltransferase involved in cell wall bisynthesis [Butyrivibrio fibrisolvens]
MSKSVLWISACVPYDTVGHAGGKIHNYYLKYLKANSDFNIKLLTFYWAGEKDKIDLDRYSIDYDLIERKIWHFPDILVNTESVLNPWNRYAGINQNYTVIQLKKYLQKHKDEGYKPDVVILQWTEMVVLIDIVKKYFPCAKYIGIEEDVKFLNFERQISNRSNNVVKSLYLNVRYKRLKKIELEACSKCDKVILNNPKDLKLLKDNGIDSTKLTEWQPYFDSFIDIPYEGNKKQVIFYGAMGRMENVEAATWLVTDVLPLVKDTEVEVLIIGSHPSEQIKALESDRVHVLGFVESIGDYFKNAICLAAPLRQGAGVKIKILEAMSAGIPVLTTDVGIEGIPAEDGKEYLHCITAEEFGYRIDELASDSQLRKNLSSNEKGFIKKRFDLEKSASRFIEVLKEILV